MSRRRRTVDYPWMRSFNSRQATDYPQEMRVVYTCDRCGRERQQSDLFEYRDYEMNHEGLGDLRDNRLGLYFVCKEGCHAFTM